MRFLFSLSLSLMFIFSACSSVNEIEPFSDDNVEGPYINIFGTVQYVDLEGGFWAIEADDGENYDPVNLPERFQKEGLKIQAEAKIRTDLISSNMAGTIIEIHTIKQRQ